VKSAVIRDVGPFVPDGVHFIPAHRSPVRSSPDPKRVLAELFDGRWVYSYAAARAANCRGDRQAEGVLAGARQPGGSDGCTSPRPGAGDHLACAPISSPTTSWARRDDLRNGDAERSNQVLPRGGFRDFHPHRGLRSHHVARRIPQQSRSRCSKCWGRFSEDLSALQRAIRWGDGDALFNLFTRTRAIRREHHRCRPGHRRTQLRPGAEKGFRAQSGKVETGLAARLRENQRT